MTMTDDTQTVETTTAPRFAITLPAAELVTAVRNVAPFASTDDTLRVLCGVNLELAADGKVTLVTTDRYVLATTEIQVGADSDLASFSGEGSVLLSADVVKMLAGVKARGSYELITLTVAADGALTVALPDTRVMTWPAGDYQGAGFPDHRKLLGAFRPCDAGAVPAACAYNPAFLAKFAKIRDGRQAPALKLTPGIQGVSDRTVSTITLAECGPVRAWIMQIRIGE